MSFVSVRKMLTEKKTKNNEVRFDILFLIERWKKVLKQQFDWATEIRLSTQAFNEQLLRGQIENKSSQQIDINETPNERMNERMENQKKKQIGEKNKGVMLKWKTSPNEFLVWRKWCTIFLFLSVVVVVVVVWRNNGKETWATK